MKNAGVDLNASKKKSRYCILSVQNVDLVILERIGGVCCHMAALYNNGIFIFDTAEAEVHVPSGALNSGNLLAARVCGCFLC